MDQSPVRKLFISRVTAVGSFFGPLNNATDPTPRDAPAPATAPGSLAVPS